MYACVRVGCVRACVHANGVKEREKGIERMRERERGGEKGRVKEEMDNTLNCKQNAYILRLCMKGKQNFILDE